VPHVLAVKKGTQVLFPDSDNVLHHVYSFSRAKTFEIDIYKEEIRRNILFENAGIVALGCNIHDWMLGYIYVAESSFFTQTDSDGNATFAYAGAANVKIKLWHPRLDKKDQQTLHSLIQSDTASDAEQAIDTEVTVRLTQALLPSYSEFDDVHGVGNYD